jgi:predicted lipoprotein with Yx(FWY)xxD motif
VRFVRSCVGLRAVQPTVLSTVTFFKETHMTRIPNTAGALVFAALLAACGSSGSSTTAATTVAPAVTVAPTAAPTPAPTAAPTPAPIVAGTEAPKSTEAPPVSAAVAAADVSVAETSLGNVLVDATGLTIYMFANDTQGKASVCEGGCLGAWPAVIAAGDNAIGGEGIDAKLLTIIPRTDGSKQLAYNGWPLYLFANDAKPGDVNGQKVGGVWFVLDATGTIIGQ